MRQVLRPGALGRPRGIRWRGRWEGGSGWGIHVTPWLIHVNVWQNPLQCCEVISLQLIKINGKKKKNWSLRDQAQSRCESAYVRPSIIQLYSPAVAKTRKWQILSLIKLGIKDLFLIEGIICSVSPLMWLAQNLSHQWWQWLTDEKVYEKETWSLSLMGHHHWVKGTALDLRAAYFTLQLDLEKIHLFKSHL